MKSILRLLFLLTMSQVSAQEKTSVKTSPKAPQTQFKILQAIGPILDSSQTTRPAVLWNMKSRVADRLSLSLGDGAQTKIQLNPDLVLTAYANTEFEIPSISWENRHFKEIKLNKGSLRFDMINRAPFAFDLITPFYQVELPVGLWVFTIDQERALADILALKGNLRVSSLNSEDKVSLKSGDRVTFRGLLEEGEIAYDLLLQGRRIPKGKWLSVGKLTSADNQKFSLEAEQKKLKEEFKKKSVAEKEKLKKQAKSLCTQPYGNLGECLWRKAEGGCYRTRCAADGKWKDSQLVGESFCDLAGGWVPTAKACDY